MTTSLNKQEQLINKLYCIHAALENYNQINENPLLDNKLDLINYYTSRLFYLVRKEYVNLTGESIQFLSETESITERSEKLFEILDSLLNEFLLIEEFPFKEVINLLKKQIDRVTL